MARTHYFPDDRIHYVWDNEQEPVLTVEPGIYIPEENIGVRIEDDILVTSAGRKNLSVGLSTGL